MLQASKTKPPNDEATTPPNSSQFRGPPAWLSWFPVEPLAEPRVEVVVAAGVAVGAAGGCDEGREWIGGAAARRWMRPRTTASPAGTVVATIGLWTGTAAPANAEAAPVGVRAGGVGGEPDGGLGGLGWRRSGRGPPAR